MKQLRQAAIFLALILLAGAAGADLIGLTDDPLTIGGGARPLGMGRAFAAVADDADAIFINPGGLALMKRPQALAMSTNLLAGDVYYSEFCGAVPSVFGSVGIGYITTGVNRISTLAGSTEVFTDYYDSVLAFSYASGLARFVQYADNVFVGLNLKLFNRGFTGGLNQTSSGFSSDFGLKYIVSPYLNLALVRQNFIPFSLGAGLHSSGGLEEALAGETRLALAAKPVPFDGKLLLAADLDLPAQSGQPATGHLGGEWKVSPNLALRLGLDQSLDSDTPGGTGWNPTFGTSFNYGGFRMDYAFHPYYNDPALATTYFSLSYTGEPWLALKGRVE